jgi:hypothetical protein
MIEGYRFGRFSFLGEEYTSDVIIHGDVVTSWWRDTGHSVALNDIEVLVAERPGTIVVGTGANGMMDVPEDTRRYIESNGIEIVVKRTDEAIHEYNRLRAEGADVAIAMHLTC